MDLDALAAIRRDLPTECEVTARHAELHLSNALKELNRVVPDLAQAHHEADLAHRILTLLRYAETKPIGNHKTAAPPAAPPDTDNFLGGVPRRSRRARGES
jgi:hypothetical protein